MNRLLASRRLTNDSGFSLVELLVYILLFAIVGTMVVMLIINGFRSQTRITETTARTGEAQNASLQLEYDVRHAIEAQVDLGGTLLRTRTFVGSGATGTWQCRGWFYDSATSTLHRTTDPTEVASASATSAASWSIYARDVEASVPFRAGAPNPDGTWNASAKAVALDFSAVPPTWGVGTKIDTIVNQRPQTDNGEGGQSTCL